MGRPPRAGHPELQALQPGGVRERQSDFDALMASGVQQTIQAEGIILLDYGALQPLWRARSSSPQSG